MLDQIELIKLQKGDKVDHFLLVRKSEIRNTKTNKNYLYLELGDQSTFLNANIWDNFNDIAPQLNAGEIVKVVGIIEEYQNTLQIRIENLRLKKPSEQIFPIDFLPKSSRNYIEMKNEFFQRINKIDNNFLKELLLKIFDDDNFKKFSFVPAGKSWHHSYIHGLLEHTLEIVRICDLIADIHPEINRDLLICGAMLHDFGKIEELSFDPVFEYTDKGKLHGHIVIAAMFVNEEINKINDFPENLKNNLLHIILSHQGKLEYASPVVPKTLEAITLYHADELSAKVNAYKNIIANEIKNGSSWSKFLSLAGTDVHSHKIENVSNKNKTLFD